MVQREMTKRGRSKNYHSSVHAFSSKIKCGHCGSWYGSKVWHSNSQYRKTIWQCNHKFDGDERCDSLTQRFETAKQHLETVMAELDRMQTQRADIEAFIESFEALPETLTEFKLENWHSLVDYATVYSIDDIRFTFKHGQEVQA